MPGILQEIDSSILIWIQEYLRVDGITPIIKLITTLGNGGMIWIVSAIVLLFFKSTRKLGILALLSLLICFLITNVMIKNIAARPRPFDMVSEIIPLVREPMDYSFPSGHTSSAFAVCWLYYRYMKRCKWLPLVSALLMGMTRMYVGVHYPTDVIAGAVIAIAVSEMIWRKFYINCDI